MLSVYVTCKCKNKTHLRIKVLRRKAMAGKSSMKSRSGTLFKPLSSKYFLEKAQFL